MIGYEIGSLLALSLDKDYASTSMFQEQIL